MRRLFWRFLPILSAALLGIGLLTYSDSRTRNYLREEGDFRNALQKLQTTFYALQSEILQDASFLYRSYDRLNRLLEEGRGGIEKLKRSAYLHNLPARSPLRRELQTLAENYGRYEERTLQFLRENAAVKNSAIYIPTLQLRAYSIFDGGEKEDSEVLLLLSRISSTIFLTKNARDRDFLAELGTFSRLLKEWASRYRGARQKLLLTLSRHLDSFRLVFPRYLDDLDWLLDRELIRKTNALLENFQRESARQMGELNLSNRLLLLLYLLSLFALFYFVYRTYRENRRLQAMKLRLERSLRTDPLTGLGNRFAYRQRQEAMEEPCLILINIDRFKHVNEFYGTNVGDQVLHRIARGIEEITPPSLHAGIYRMGGDDYGILFEKERLDRPLPTLLYQLQEALSRYEVRIEDLQIELSYTFGASTEKNWLFETADMALKAAKSSQREHVALYTPTLDKRREISHNLQILHTIRHALDEEKLLPHYQAIQDLRRRKTAHFEALARIRTDGPTPLLEPKSFIGVATEAKLSGEITLQVLERTLREAQSNDAHFSVNVSSADIEYGSGREKILELLQRYPSASRRMIFEILESEEIDDYELMSDFIGQVKRFGCTIALDDFGSGYSNMEKLLQLDIDDLKVDGSLIRKIDHDQHAELIVRTILAFARDTGWKSVAEFVHSRAIYEKVIELGFDYAQGYFIGKPKPDPTPSILDRVG